MDTRLVLAVVLVTLAWMSAGTKKMAVDATNGNNTSGNMTNGNMTGGNMTNGNMTGGNMTSGNMTAGHNMTNPNMTAGHNMTNPNMTAGHNMTNPNMTNPNMTAGHNMTNTTAPNPSGPLTTNTTVEILEAPISREECGKSQICADAPTGCDPAKPGSCFFVAAKSRGGQNFEFQLSGETDGYISCTLSTDSTLGGNDNTYVCANNNGTVVFITAVLNNNQLTEKNLSVNSVKGKVNGTKVQCTFVAAVPDSSARASARFSMAVSTGPYNSSTGALGTPNTKIQTNVVDLSNPNSTVVNQVDNTAATATPPAAATTAGHAVALQQPLSQALLIIMGVLGLAVL